MKFKSSDSLWLIFLGTPLLWFSTPLWIDDVAKYILKNNQDCLTEGLLQENCQALISAYGAAGDVFGVVTSLFTGLALFAVAVTLWIDSKSRSEAKKPLVVTALDSDSIYFHDAQVHSERQIKFHINVNLNNPIGEAALNVAVEGILFHNDTSLSIGKSHLETPLISGNRGNVQFTGTLSGIHFTRFLSELTQDGSSISLKLHVTYQSLENVKWRTSVTYSVYCDQPGQRGRLNAARAKSEDFENLWTGDPIVSLSPRVAGGSWEHNKA